MSTTIVRRVYWASAVLTGLLFGWSGFTLDRFPSETVKPSQSQPAAFGPPVPSQPVTPPPGLRPTTRAEIIRAAESMAAYRWTCRAANTQALCLRGFPYRPDWQAGEEVTGVAYDWGGDDNQDLFARKLAAGYAAGSHSRDGVSQCTAGIDCSGFVQFCWGLRGRPYSTWTLHHISDRVTNPFTGLRPGDALNKASSHIVLFAGYRPDGNPIVYEANGGAARVIRNETSTWARYRDYVPLRYRYVID